MPLQATSGAASYDAFGGGVPVVPNYIEEVFSTYLYTGTGTNQTITNGIDLSTKGGLVWTKGRNYAFNHWLIDTVRGNTNIIKSNTTDAASNLSGGGGAITSFNTTGYGVNLYDENNSPAKTFVSWTFRKQPKFFDVVTYTGTGSVQTIAHNLGSVPGCIIVKSTSNAGTNWAVYHRSVGATGALFLQLTNATNVDNDFWNDTTPTSTVFTVRASSATNATGYTYVAYLFAHNAGGFGLTGTDNVISCGYAAGGTTVNLGYEPQWVLVKNPNSASNWLLVDNMRGMPADGGGAAKGLLPNTSDAESDWGGYVQPTSTGFYNGVDAIYIAIRRGPMKVPTSGTSVFGITTSAGTSPAYVSSFPVDFAYRRQVTGTSDNYFHTRLQGAKTLYPNYTVAEDDDSNVTWAYQNGMFTSTGANANQYGWLMRRAPSFMDVVCWRGNGASSNNQTHNLTVVPELVIYKNRTSSQGWYALAKQNSTNSFLWYQNAFTTSAGSTGWVTSDFCTSTTIQVGDVAWGGLNDAFTDYVAYLFASCSGVSKVGTYTGNGSTQTIDCGFTGGARFVIIKRTDSTGGWYVYDTVRGMTVLTDPYVFLNDNAAQVATLGSVTTVSTGFAVNATILAAINTNAASYIFLAIA